MFKSSPKCTMALKCNALAHKIDFQYYPGMFPALFEQNKRDNFFANEAIGGEDLRAPTIPLSI